ncbi:MAG TPA: acylphosphatase [Burkholderiales bacterium]
MAARHLQITGRVQGVGFRYSMQREATRVGVRGWVRNRRDGSVEALVQGNDAAIAAITDWARHGPPGARVEEVRVANADPEENLASFEQRPTA